MQETEACKNLAKYSTFKIGGEAKGVFIPENLDDFKEMLAKSDNILVVGTGSNILFSSDYVDKNIILTSKLDKFQLDNNILTAQAGVKGALVANFLADRGFSGLEFLIGFPAKIGGAVCQNASAQGQAIEDTFLEAKVFDLSKKKEIILNKEQMKFSYRTSILSSDNYILLEAKFALCLKDVEQVKETIKKNVEFRKAHQPMLSLPNVGSIFKNPPQDSAGRLLDACGFKGVKVGGAQVWENHANFIVNTDSATSLDVLKLMYQMKSKVLEKFNINLIPEIKYFGGGNKEEEDLWKLLQK